MYTSLVNNTYFKKNKNGISQFETMSAYLGGSAFQTIVDNPITAYRQLVQQYAKDLKGNIVHPTIAKKEAQSVFVKNPVGASMSGLGPRLVGVGFKRVPTFGFLLGISSLMDKETGNVGLVAATGASIFSAPFINPIRMIEPRQIIVAAALPVDVAGGLLIRCNKPVPPAVVAAANELILRHWSNALACVMTKFLNH